jgi:hypothetical protein
VFWPGRAELFQGEGNLTLQTWTCRFPTRGSCRGSSFASAMPLCVPLTVQMLPCAALPSNASASCPATPDVPGLIAVMRTCPGAFITTDVLAVPTTYNTYVVYVFISCFTSLRYEAPRTPVVREACMALLHTCYGRRSLTLSTPYSLFFQHRRCSRDCSTADRHARNRAENNDIRPESFISIASRANHLPPRLRERRGTEDNEKLNIK